MDEIRVLILLNAGTLVSILGLGIRFLRIFNRMELKTEILWTEYETRVGQQHPLKS